jgi:hypothetical protein
LCQARRPSLCLHVLPQCAPPFGGSIGV